MLGFSMIQLTKTHSEKLDKELRKSLVHLYKPLRRTPCFLHRSIEKYLEKRKKFPVIIEFEEEKVMYSGISKVHDLVGKEKHCKVEHEFPSTCCCSGVLTASAIEKILSDDCHIKKIYYDREVMALLDVASPAVHARALNQMGLTGKGVNIAVVDTGVYPHQDLTQPENRLIAFKDVVNNREEAYDDNGHGTHCAGDAAGNGFASNDKYQGPAPEAGIIGVKVLNQMGSGSLSTIIAGIQWCIDHKEEYQIDILSLSLGAAADESDCDDPLVQIVDQAWESGIVVIVAAGNSGPDQRTVATPGISSKVITVGAVDDRNTVERSDEQIASFSSRGPACGEDSKPDLVTPGVNIVSLRSPGSYLDKTSKSNRVEDDYFNLSGTSMATPICAGVAALILQEHPEYTPDQVKQQLLAGAVDIGLPPYVQGAGYLDAEKALEFTGREE
ncbi:S8 family peptidase [Halobacillus karajensis]|uniref:Serine protease AprX n=1 Tax=Halobacillus karajensis TaxID=195088 RepID=A0A024P4X1_9BACI|nr:S8 family peptidase [Halobacillus karajensis]CDQ20596.1 Serine protease AprX [Halobacillus karajensis]CDQ23935.1 Serine protease AprX [Halobacillus karajensis]CDQ27413.1 Serine protease AprX [Halobacillus karajensis]